MQIDRETLENSDLIESTFKFWFNDNEHIRSPFASYLHPMLKQDATAQFFEWVEGLKTEAKDELNDEGVAEKFEEIIFETARLLARTEDEKVTILYPFLPRLGDVIYENQETKSGESIIIDRKLTEKGDDSYLKVILNKKENNEEWETKFELPTPVH